MTTQRRRAADDILSAEGVAEYLKTHPEFFEQQADLLARLYVPHRTGDAVSLVEKQVQILREQNQHLERRLVDLMEIARSNDRLIGRMHSLALAMILAEEPVDALRKVPEIMRREFEADAVAFIVFEDAGLPEVPGIRTMDREDDRLEAFAGFLSASKPQCGRFRDGQLELLFDAEAKRIKSAAVIPVGENIRYGILAVGSRREDRFAPGMSTDFLRRLGELIAARIS